MSTLTVGRCSLADPQEIDHDGDRSLKVSGWMQGTSLSDLKMRRQQLLGLADTDRAEAVVPVTWDADSTFDGYYRLARPPRVTPVEASYSTLYAFRYDLELERVDGGYQLPSVESYLYGSSRTGIPAGTTAAYWHAVPSTRIHYDFLGAPNSSVATRSGSGGTVYYLPSASYAAGYARMRIEPDNWYDMSATVKVEGNDVVGACTINSTGSWELSNGYIRVTATSNSSATFYVQGPTSTSSTWGTPQGYCVGYSNSILGWVKLPYTQIKSVTPLRTQPWCSALRLTLHHAVYTYDGVEVYCDLRLRRGSAVVEAVLTTTSYNASFRYGMEQTLNSTHTTITSGGGLRPSGDDADGNRWVLLTGTATATETWSTGRMYLSGATTAAIDFGIGFERKGGSSAGPNRSTDLRDQYFAAMDETVHFGIGR